MKTNLFLLSIFTLLLPFVVSAEWISISKTKTTQTEPKITLVSSNKTSTTIKIELSGFDLKSIETEAELLQSISLLSNITITEEGDPEISHLAKILAIPNNASLSYEVLEVGELHTFSNINLAPVRKSWLEGASETPYRKNKTTYELNTFFPQEYVKIGEPAIFRDFRIARISMFPMRYNPVKKEIQIASSITIKINYGKDATKNIKTTRKKAIAPSFAAIYKSMIFNYQAVLETEYNGKEEGHDVLLYIMPDEFVPSFTSYLDWKVKSGNEVIVTKFSDISASSNNPVTIRNHISDLYNNSENPPTYVILVGDEGIFPHKIAAYSDYSFPDDDFFVKVDGIDFFPDIFVGRIPNQTVSRLDIILNKFLLYQKNPFVSDPSWYKKATVCSNNQYESQVETKRFTAEILRNEGNFSTVDTLMSDWGCTVSLNQITNAINEGRSFLNYRGEGWSNGWHANCYYFSTDDVSSLNNGQKFTFVTSIGCGVAMFNAGGGNCFGEQWIKGGTLDNPRGAIAFIGPTSNTHTAQNNKLDKGIYIGMFQEGLSTPGQALLRGKFQMYLDHGNDPWVEYHYTVYCTLGDPSVNIWKTEPLPTIVNYPESIEINKTEAEIEVFYSATGFPVRNANIVIKGANLLVNSKTNNEGKAILNVNTNEIEELSLTITGQNIIPFTATINTVVSIDEIDQPRHMLEQNIPNPFSKETLIPFSINNPSTINLSIFNINGQQVKTIINETKATGSYNAIWDGTDDNGIELESGIYFYRLQTNGATTTKRLLKIK